MCHSFQAIEKPVLFVWGPLS